MIYGTSNLPKNITGILGVLECLMVPLTRAPLQYSSTLISTILTLPILNRREILATPLRSQ